MESNVTPSLSRSWDCFTIATPIVSWGACRECIVRDLENIIVLVLLAFNFITKRSHHSLILQKSRFTDSATIPLTHEEGTINIHESGVSVITYHLILQNCKNILLDICNIVRGPYKIVNLKIVLCVQAVNPTIIIHELIAQWKLIACVS